MRKLILTAVALMCSGLWAVAQSSSTPDTSSANPSSQSAGAPSSSASSSGATTIDGCLSGAAGSYTLKDKASGTTYNLTGPTSALSAHVGHEVQVTGTVAPSSSASASGSASSATSSTPSSASGSSNAQTMSVTSAKMVSSSCSNQ